MIASHVASLFHETPNDTSFYALLIGSVKQPGRIRSSCRRSTRTRRNTVL